MGLLTNLTKKQKEIPTIQTNNESIFFKSFFKMVHDINESKNENFKTMK